MLGALPALRAGARSGVPRWLLGRRGHHDPAAQCGAAGNRVRVAPQPRPRWRFSAVIKGRLTYRLIRSCGWDAAEQSRHPTGTDIV